MSVSAQRNVGCSAADCWGELSGMSGSAQRDAERNAARCRLSAVDRATAGGRIYKGMRARSAGRI